MNNPFQNSNDELFRIFLHQNKEQFEKFSKDYLASLTSSHNHQQTIEAEKHCGSSNKSQPLSNSNSTKKGKLSTSNHLIIFLIVKKKVHRTLLLLYWELWLPLNCQFLMRIMNY
jgi:hypothetical protein